MRRSKLLLTVLWLLVLGISMPSTTLAQDVAPVAQKSVQLFVYLDSSSPLVEKNNLSTVADTITALAFLYADDVAVTVSVFSSPTAESPDTVGALGTITRSDDQYAGLNKSIRTVKALSQKAIQGTDYMAIRQKGLSTVLSMTGSASNPQVIVVGEWFPDAYAIQCAAANVPVVFIQPETSQPAPDAGALEKLGCANVTVLEPTDNVLALVESCYRQLNSSDCSVLYARVFEAAETFALPAPLSMLRERKLVTYGATQKTDVVYTEKNMTCAKVADFSASIPLEMKKGSSLLVVNHYDHYNLLDLNGEKNEVKKNAPVTLNATITKDTTDSLQIDDWAVCAIATKDAGHTSFPLTYNETVAQYSGDATFLTGGSYSIQMEATSASTGLTLRSEPVLVEVANATPTVQNKAALLQLWKGAPVAPEQFQLDLTTVFADDDGDALKFSIQPTAGININDSFLVANTDQAQSGEIVVSASDGEAVSEATIAIQSIDVGSQLTQSLISLNLPGECYKNCPAALNGVLRLPDGIDSYLDYLRSCEQETAFEQSFEGTFEITYPDGTSENLVTVPQWDESRHSLVFDAAPSMPSIIGECTVTFTVGWAQSSLLTTQQMSIVNKAPVCKKTGEQFEVKLPDLLGSPDDPQDFSASLEDYIEYEQGDLLQIRSSLVNSSDVWLLPANEDGSYILTDQASGAASVSEIAWDTTTGQAPVIHLSLTRPNEIVLRLSATDHDGASMEPDLEFSIDVHYAHEAIFKQIAVYGACGITALLLLLIILRLIKPSFKRTSLGIEVDGRTYEMPMGEWKKQPATLRQLIYCFALPITSSFSMADCNDVFIVPAKAGGFTLYRKKENSIICMLDNKVLQKKRTLIAANQVLTVQLGDHAIHLTSMQN